MNRYLVIILILSGFVHLFNPVGFPDIFFDEGVYMSRTMNVLQNFDPQESYLYDHPYFGQILLASTLKLVGYPDSLSPESDVESLKELYMIPRLFMGLLAVLDTFLIYKIAEKKYNNKVAILTGIIFAVIPFSWVFKRITLDALLLPFLLGSILAALHAQKSQKLSWVLLSGVLFGFAVFTKIPAVMFALLVGVIIFQNRKKITDIAVWLAPTILIPFMWIAHSLQRGEFDLFLNGVFWQTERQNSILKTFEYFFDIDPLLVVLGTAGIFLAVYKKDYFILMGTIPFIIFLGIIGFTQYFYLILIVPILCIASSRIVLSVVEKFGKQHSEKIIVTCIVVIVIFGMASLIPLLILDVSDSQFQALSFVLGKTEDNSATILASPVYSWILDDVFLRKNVPIDYSTVLFYDDTLEKIVLVADYHFMLDIKRGIQLEQLYNKSQIIQTFDSSVSSHDTELYPYSSLKFNFEGNDIQIRTNFEN